MTNPTRIQLRRGSTAQWDASGSLLLASGEIGFVESGADKGKFKLGDGTSTWDQLEYFVDSNALSSFVTQTSLTSQLNQLIDGAPETLNTLNELAAALSDDANYASTVTTALATKLPLAGGTMTGVLEMGTNKITGLGTPTNNTDASTKLYVDELGTSISNNYSLNTHTHTLTNLSDVADTLTLTNGYVLTWNNTEWISSPVPAADLSNYVTLDGSETITGIKTLTTPKIASATLMATPVSGTMEYDGNSLYYTPNSLATSGRSVVYTPHMFILSSNYAHQNNANLQSMFGSVFNLAAATTYEVEAVMRLANTTAASINMQFLLSSSTVVSSCLLDISAHIIGDTSSSTSTSQAINYSSMYVQNNNSSTIPGSSIQIASSSSTGKIVKIKGFIRTNTAGTIELRGAWSTSPGTAYTGTNSFIKFTPIGTNSVTSIGKFT